MSEVSPQEFGALQAEVRNLKEVVASQSEKIDQLLALANGGKGAYWATLFIATSVGSLLTMVINAFRH